MRKYLNLRAIIAQGLLIAFLANFIGPLPHAQADEFHLPAPGVMVHLSPEFNPPILKGIKVHPDNPFKFDFILDQGDYSLPPVGRVREGGLKPEATKLIKYFLASLTIPENDLWVNLSPYEKNRIIPQSFGLTEMGRDLLAEDYMLKQITASLIYPEDTIGKKFWKRIYKEAYKKFGTTNIPVNTFNKVWIIPDKAVVYENAKAGTAYVVESKLKVMLEEDYLSLEKHKNNNSLPLAGRVREGGVVHTHPPSFPPQGGGINALGSQIVREIVIPELTREVNENKNFSQLRQVYNSLILATWYKKKIKDSILAQVYEDKKKVTGVGYNDPKNNTELIYQRYLQAFKKGVFNYIKEDIVSVSGVQSKEQGIFPRKYFSGGTSFSNAAMASALSFRTDAAAISMPTLDEAEVVQVKLDQAVRRQEINGVRHQLSSKKRNGANLVKGDQAMNVVHRNIFSKEAYALPMKIFGGNGDNLIDVFARAWQLFVKAHPERLQNTHIVLQPRGSVNYMVNSENVLDWENINNFQFVVYLPPNVIEEDRRSLDRLSLISYVNKILQNEGYYCYINIDQELVLEGKDENNEDINLFIEEPPTGSSRIERIFKPEDVHPVLKMFVSGSQMDAWDRVLYDPTTTYFRLGPDGAVQEERFADDWQLASLKVKDLIDNLVLKFNGVMKSANGYARESDPKIYKRLAVAAQLLAENDLAKTMIIKYRRGMDIGNSRKKRFDHNIALMDIERLSVLEAQKHLGVAKLIIERLNLLESPKQLLKMVLNNPQLMFKDCAMNGAKSIGSNQAMDGKTILRFSHGMKLTGGLELYVASLDHQLLTRNHRINGVRHQLPVELNNPDRVVEAGKSENQAMLSRRQLLFRSAPLLSALLLPNFLKSSDQILPPSTIKDPFLNKLMLEIGKLDYLDKKSQLKVFKGLISALPGLSRLGNEYKTGQKTAQETVEALYLMIKRAFKIDRGDNEFDMRLVIKNKNANCIGSAQLFLIAGGAIGLDVIPIEVRNDMQGVFTYHVATLVKLADHRYIGVDLLWTAIGITKPFDINELFVQEGIYLVRKNREDHGYYQRIRILDTQGLLAFVNNETGEGDYTGAIKRDPYNVYAYENLGSFINPQGVVKHKNYKVEDYRTMAGALLKAIELDPESLANSSSLRAVFQVWPNPDQKFVHDTSRKIIPWLFGKNFPFKQLPESSVTKGQEFEEWVAIDKMFKVSQVDHAMKAVGPKRGGIDFTPANMHLQTKIGSSPAPQNDNGGIKFHLDPAMLAQLQNATGFVPVIINIQPLTDLRTFLGLPEMAKSGG